MRLRCLALWRQCLMLFAGLMLLGPASGAPPAPVHLPPQPEPVRADFFGTHLHALVAEPLRAQPVTLRPATPWPERQIGALRLWDAGLRWADLEPQRGAWQFERMDAYVDAATRRGVRIVHVLGSTPRWASARPNEPCPYGQGCSAEPADFSRWDDYVRTLVRRYRGRIHDYELWNEPYFHDLPADRNKPQAFFSGTAATLVEMARRAHAIVRAEDPAARLLSPGFVGGPYRLDLYLRAGGGEWMSALAYHLYADDDDGALVLVDAARATLRRHGLGSLAIVNTETGFAADAADPSRAAALLARSMIVTAFAGVQGYYHYAWDNQRSGMLDARGGTDSVTARAYGNVRRWLLGTRMDGCNTTAASLVRCTGRRDGQTLVIYWRQHGREDAPLEALPASGTATVQSAIDAQPAAMVGSRRIGVGSVPVAIWSDSP